MLRVRECPTACCVLAAPETSRRETQPHRRQGQARRLQTQESLHTVSPDPPPRPPPPNPGIATYSLPDLLPDLLQTQESYIRPPRPTSQTSPDLLPDPLSKTFSKPRNRYIRPPRPTPDLQTQESLQNPPSRPPQTYSKLKNRYIRTPRTTPDLYQTQDSQYSLDIHSTTQHNTIQHDCPTRHSTTTRHPKQPSHDAKHKQYWDTSLGYVFRFFFVF